MVEKGSFVFYKSWKDAINGLPADIRLEIYEGIIEYATSGKVPEFKPMAAIAFNFIKNDLDRTAAKYEKIVERNRRNGKNGGRPKNQENPNNPVGFLETQQKHNEDEDDNEDDDDVLLEKETKGTREKKNDSDFFEILEQTNSGKSQKTKSSKKVAPKKVSFKPPNFQEFWDYTSGFILEKKIGDPVHFKISIEAKFNQWNENQWKDGNGRQILNWKTKIQNTLPFLKPISNGNYHNANPAANSSAKSTNGSQNGKVSARQFLAREFQEQSSRDNQSGDITIDAEVVD